MFRNLPDVLSRFPHDAFPHPVIAGLTSPSSRYRSSSGVAVYGALFHMAFSSQIQSAAVVTVCIYVLWNGSVCVCVCDGCCYLSMYLGYVIPTKAEIVENRID